MNQNLIQTHILNKKSFYTLEDIRIESISIIKDFPDMLKELSLTMQFYNNPESLKPFATANIKACQIESIQFTERKDFGNIGLRITKELKHLEQSYRKEAIEKYLETNYRSCKSFEGAFVYDRIRFSDDILEQEKISTAVSGVFKEVIAKTGISEESGRKILIVSEETGREVSINKQAEFSKELDDNFLLRTESEDKIGFHIIAIERSFIKQSIEALHDKYYAVIMNWLYPFRSDYSKDIKLALKQVKKYSYFKRSRLKTDALNELINIIIDNEGNQMKAISERKPNMIGQAGGLKIGHKANPDKKAKRKQAEASRRKNR